MSGYKTLWMQTPFLFMTTAKCFQFVLVSIDYIWLTNEAYVCYLFEFPRLLLSLKVLLSVSTVLCVYYRCQSFSWLPF